MTFWIEYLTIAIYLLFLLGMGFAFRSMNRNIDDYVRGGAQGTWWLVGSSIVMSGISAFTFTGNAGAAFQGGFSQLIIYLAQVAAFLLSALFLAPWFRQTRVLTGPDIYRNRYGPEVEQFISYLAFVSGIVTASLWLWGLATFCSAVFQIPIHFTILAIGAVTLLYSTTGGRWAVLATDFIQSLILFPLSILLAILCLRQIGGFGGLFEAMHAPEVERELRFFKAADTFPDGKFGIEWMIMTFLLIFFQSISFSSAGKYFSVKDSPSARKAALLAAVLMGIGSIIWFIPPIVARLLYADEVLAAPLGNAHEASYAVIARLLLPNGLLGLMTVAMFSATMSSMDSGLNGAAGIVVRNMLPPLASLCGKRNLGEKAQLAAGQIATLLLGFGIIGLTLLLSRNENLSLFDTFFTITTVIALPTAVPATLAVFIRPLPRWSYFFATACGAAVSATSVIQESLFDIPWTVQDRTIWVFAATTLATVATIPFYLKGWFTSERYRTKVNAFYDQMHTPIDFKAEIGESLDFQQMHRISFFAVGLGLFVWLLLFLPNDAEGRICILGIGGFSILIGGLLRFASKRLSADPHND